MRLIGMGLLAFLLAGIALFLSRSEAFQMSTRVLMETFQGPQLRFETAHQPPKTQSGQSEVIAQRVNPDEPIILTGLPAYQGASFYLPTEARPTSGYLQLDVTVQALAGVEGVLRISIGTNRRAELLLRPGEAGRSLRIDLTTDDLTRERLVVSFSLQGEGPHDPCGVDAGLEAIVEIETTSALFLTLDKAALSDRDRANMNGRQVALHWGETQAERAAALSAALHLQGSNWDVVFADATSALDPLIVREDFAKTGRGKVANFAWSDRFKPSSSLFGMRRFKRTHTWRIRYDMLDASDPKLPAEFTLSMVLGHVPHGAHWHLSVTLNDRLIEQALLPPNTTNVMRKIDVSDGHHARLNVIEIVLSSTADNAGACSVGPDLLAEVTDETTLTAGAASFSDPLLFLREALTRAGGWHLIVEPTLTAPEAVLSSTLLSRVLKVAVPNASETGVAVHALARGASLQSWRAERAGAVWLVFFEEDGRITVQPLTDHPGPDTRAVTLLIDLSEAAT